MRRGATGDWIATTTGNAVVRAFVPAPLPPVPPLVIDGQLQAELDAALVALGRLDSVTALLPDPALFLYAYVRKEAVLSSQIEGTQSSLSDLLLFEIDEAPGVPLDDVSEVSSYVAALEHGVARLRGGFPLSNRLLREVHEVLLAKGRGSDKHPGEFRRSQNWIGGTRPGNAIFVPPPPDRVESCMTALERFLNDEPQSTSILLKAALAHAQFETIHPFLDGNGRVGRLLVTLLLHQAAVLQDPLLYLSLFLKKHRSHYYDLLQRVRTDGDWETWVQFFAEGVRETADGAVLTAKRLVALFEADRSRIEGLRGGTGSVLRVHDALRHSPLTSAKRLSAATGISIPTINSALAALEQLGIARETTGRKRDRLFSYAEYLRLLSDESD